MTTTSPSASDSLRDDVAAERALVQAAQSGDDAAFGALYVQHAPRIFALLSRLTGDDVTAADLLQDTFLHAWRGLSAWRGESAVATWLHRIAVNAHLATLRARQRREVHELAHEELDSLAGIATPAAEPGARIDLERAIAALPPGMRTAFVLRDVEGYGYDEIAALTGNAAGTIRAQVSRARLLLSRELER